MRRVRNVTNHFIIGKHTSSTPLTVPANSANSQSIDLRRASLIIKCFTFSNFSWSFLCVVPSLGAHRAVPDVGQRGGLLQGLGFFI